MKLKYLILAAIAGAIVTADQATKMYVLTHLQLGEIIEVIPNFFNFTHVNNPGAAFGFLSGSHEAFREIFFLSMPPIALLIILAILRGVPEGDKWTICALSAVFGGAIGNYIDRLRFRHVIDFIDFTIVYDAAAMPPKRFVYPAFNIADIAIVSGVAILLFLEFTRNKKTKADAV
ncbi:MAG TPA: signal peptidase II [Bdellovibrionales bacterium]|jgi:signal peptidase II|nr:signal peptidase II [Bdellovibrionales bacterium]